MINSKPITVKMLASYRGLTVQRVNQIIAASRGALVKKNGKLLLAEWDAFVARKNAPAEESKPIASMTWDERKDRASALQKEMELEVAKGKLVDLATVQADFAQFNAELLSVLRRVLESELPGQFSGDIALQVAAATRTAIDNICQRITRQEKKLASK